MSNQYGKWIKTVEITGSYLATGSLAPGCAGILLDSSATGVLNMGQGDDISLGDLTEGVVYDFSIHYVSMSAGTSYILYKNPIANF